MIYYKLFGWDIIMTVDDSEFNVVFLKDWCMFHFGNIKHDVNYTKLLWGNKNIGLMFKATYRRFLGLQLFTRYARPMRFSK